MSLLTTTPPTRSQSEFDSIVKNIGIANSYALEPDYISHQTTDSRKSSFVWDHFLCANVKKLRKDSKTLEFTCFTSE